MKLKQYFKTTSYLFLLLIISGVIFVFNTSLAEQESQQYQSCSTVKEDTVFQLGNVFINTVTREISFQGEIRQEKGWVQFLLYLCGYGWLEKEAAIVSEANLADLQKAIALLNWQLWDQLWLGETCGREKEVEIFLKWDKEKIAPNELIVLEYSLGIGDLIFLGSPFFDPLFLEQCRQKWVCIALVEASRCPLFLLHETIKEKFVRESGQSGYLLNYDKLPPLGTQISIVIRVPYHKEAL